MPVNTWLVTVDVSDEWKNFQENGFQKSVELIVAKIKESGWRDLTPYPDTFDELLADLENSYDLDEFNGWWNELYDLADSDRVWIATI